MSSAFATAHLSTFLIATRLVKRCHLTQNETQMKTTMKTTMKTCHALLASFVLLTGCVAHKPYWVKKTSGWSSTNESMLPEIPQTNGYDLRVIEFDDHGDKWAPSQTPAALDMIKNAKKPLTVVYIHGWKHNAGKKDGDLYDFNKLLKKLAEHETTHRVCGVYIGWRGDYVPAEYAIPTLGLSCLARQYSVYNRMAAADRLAHGIPLPQTLNRIVATTKSSKDGKCVLIGHSLGARILENVTTRTLAESSGKFNSTEHPLADMILLVNPASDAQRARQAILATEWPHEKRPAIILMRSETDWATGWLYTDAMSAGKAFRATRQYPMKEGYSDSSQRKYITHTATTVPNMLSHRINETPKGYDNTTAKDKDAFSYNLKPKPDQTQAAFILRDKQENKNWATLERTEKGSSLLFDPKQKTCLYWTMLIPDHVLHGHGGDKKENGIFNERMVDLFAALYSMTASPSAPGNFGEGKSVMETPLGGRLPTGPAGRTQ